MTGRLPQLVARLGLAILLIANGPANAFALSQRSACSCQAAADVAVQTEACAEAKPTRCGCCKRKGDPARQKEQTHAKPEKSERQRPVEDTPGACQVQADCPCCPHCPHCPAGCCVCSVSKAPSHHADALFSVDMTCLDQHLADLSLSVPIPPFCELLQVPRA